MNCPLLSSGSMRGTADESHEAQNQAARIRVLEPTFSVSAHAREILQNDNASARATGRKENNQGDAMTANRDDAEPFRQIPPSEGGG